MPAMRAAPVLLALVLCACATPPGDAPPTARYTCADGAILSVTFMNGTALVVRGGQTFTLPQQISGYGFWYGDGRHELRGKSKEATWTVGRMLPTTCLAI